MWPFNRKKTQKEKDADEAAFSKRETERKRRNAHLESSTPANDSSISPFYIMGVDPYPYVQDDVKVEDNTTEFGGGSGGGGGATVDYSEPTPDYSSQESYSNDDVGGNDSASDSGGDGGD